MLSGVGRKVELIAVVNVSRGLSLPIIELEVKQTDCHGLERLVLVCGLNSGYKEQYKSLRWFFREDVTEMFRMCTPCALSNSSDTGLLSTGPGMLTLSGTFCR